MTGAQEAMLLTLQYGDTPAGLARRTGYPPATTMHILDGLYRRSLATTTGRWHLTRRGHNKVLRIKTAPTQEVTA